MRAIAAFSAQHSRKERHGEGNDLMSAPSHQEKETNNHRAMATDMMQKAQKKNEAADLDTSNTAEMAVLNNNTTQLRQVTHLVVYFTLGAKHIDQKKTTDAEARCGNRNSAVHRYECVYRCSSERYCLHCSPTMLGIPKKCALVCGDYTKA